MATGTRWGTDFDPDRLARARDADVEGLLPPPAGSPVRPAREGDPRAGARVRGRAHWRRACSSPGPPPGSPARPATTSASRPDIGRGYRLLRLPDHVDVEAVARHELRWWVVRREIGLAAGTAAGESITDLYASLYDVPRERVAEAGRLRGIAAEVRDRGATDDPDGPTGRGRGLLARGRAAPPRFVPEPQRRSRRERRGDCRATDDGRAVGLNVVSGRPDAARRATRRPGRCPPRPRAWPRPRRRTASGRSRSCPGRQVPDDGQPRQADGVDHDAADEHHPERPADTAIPAELGEPADDGAASTNPMR